MRRNTRAIRIEGAVAYIQLTKDYEAVIDVEDAPLVKNYNWSVVVRPHVIYAKRTSLRSMTGKRLTVFLHREIMNAPDHLEVDHINKNGLDNRRSNLRLATRQQNACNQKAHADNRSGIKGVTQSRGRWAAYIQVKGVAKNLGRFPTKEMAHIAYKEASGRLHGEFGSAS